MASPIYSRCGMRCDQCLIYRPNVEKEDRRKEICAVYSKIYPGYNPDPATIICDGCLCEKETGILLEPACKARKCVKEKGLVHCGYCTEYPCKDFPAEPNHEELKKYIDEEKKWTWEEEKLMTAYNCKKNMDEFRACARKKSDELSN